jgi:hypothetical protein
VETTIDQEALAGIRDVTDDEVEFYLENGWVMLPGLVCRELTALLLQAAIRLMEEPGFSPGQNWQVHEPVATAGIEPFRSVAFSWQMGRVAQRLINRKRLTGVDLPVLFHSDHVWRKGPGSPPSGYHQDGVLQGADRVGEFNMWLALDEVTPEMGAMRFLTGSHREGPLGMTSANLGEDGKHDPDRRADPEDGRRRDTFREHYPGLFDLYPLSAPFHYRPGDATVHPGFMVHGAPANETDRDRWSYILQYTPADTRYVDGSTTEDAARAAELALPVDRAKNPVAYPPDP